VSLPVTVLNASVRNPALGATDYIGWAIFGVGLLLESVADMQKLYFKKNSDGLWIDVGVWRWSRRPNYFGEMLVWIGAFLSAARVLHGGEWAVIVGPIFIVLLLLFVSGIPLVEASADKKHANGPRRSEYLVYKRQTSILFPMPKWLYDPLPQRVKETILLDWPMYNHLESDSSVAAANESTPVLK
jgi:steroid 5-alpha reductase family enzyme